METPKCHKENMIYNAVFDDDGNVIEEYYNCWNWSCKHKIKIEGDEHE